MTEKWLLVLFALEITKLPEGGSDDPHGIYSPAASIPHMLETQLREKPDVFGIEPNLLYWPRSLSGRLGRDVKLKMQRKTKQL